jgi:hypothetical protein
LLFGFTGKQSLIFVNAQLNHVIARETKPFERVAYNLANNNGFFVQKTHKTRLNLNKLLNLQNLETT